MCPANKSRITNNCIFFLLNIAEHENFSADKYENANYFWYFYVFSREVVKLFHAYLS